MKVSELSDAILDLWVARAAGMDRQGRWGLAWISHGNPDRPRKPRCNVAHADWTGAKVFAPSRKWSACGPIMERNLIGFTTGFSKGQWCAAVELTAETYFDGGVLGGEHMQSGPTPLIAAMRTYVASKFGEEVPDEVPA